MAASVTRRHTVKVLNRRNERNILTFYEKIAVIRYAEDANISRNRLARIFHCCATQIRRILERKHVLLQQLATLSETDAYTIIEEMTRKRRKFEMSAVGFILHHWVERCRQMRLRVTITDQTLKETAMKMAAILNLPAFRPSYRWLRHFRNKYKYSGDNLGLVLDTNAVAGEISVEDIIIEYKDALPSFMQKEITAITSSVKCMDDDAVDIQCKPLTTTTTIAADALMAQESSDDYDDLTDDGSDQDESKIPKPDTATAAADTVAKATENSLNHNTNPTQPKTLTPPGSDGEPLGSEDEHQLSTGTSELLNGVFPHMAVIHQFALLNADAKALELISQLGVHMQMQATAGAYKQLPPAAHNNNNNNTDPDSGNCGGFDDIVLIE